VVRAARSDLISVALCLLAVPTVRGRELFGQQRNGRALYRQILQNTPSTSCSNTGKTAWLTRGLGIPGAVDVGWDTKTGREGYRAWMESRVLECFFWGGMNREQEEQWKRIRRGWYLGDRRFKERLRRTLGRM